MFFPSKTPFDVAIFLMSPSENDLTSQPVNILLSGLIFTISSANLLVTPTKSTIPVQGTEIPFTPKQNGSISLISSEVMYFIPSISF